MVKVAIFMEGQTELIFVRNLLLKRFDNINLSFECLKLHGTGTFQVPFKYSPPTAKIYFLLVNVGNDTKVASAIHERSDNLFKRGFDRIIGLRDLYCDAYEKRSPNKINDQISQNLIESANTVIANLVNSDHIIIFFAIMEIESWFLAMYNIFAKINSVLTLEFIGERLGYNLKEIDPQTEFYRPTIEIKKLFQLCGAGYDKSLNEIEAITSKMELEDFDVAFENGRCTSFRMFYQQINQYVP